MGRDYDDRDREYDRGRGRDDRDKRRDGPVPKVSLLIRNLPMDVRPEEVRARFEKYGEVRDIYLPMDYYTRRPRGFGFIEYRDPRDADEAQYRLNGSNFNGRSVEVCFSKEARKTPREMLQRDNQYSGGGRGGGERGPSRYNRSRSPRRGRSHSPKRRGRSASRSPRHSRSPPRRQGRERERSYSRGRSGEPRRERSAEPGRERSAEPRRERSAEPPARRDASRSPARGDGEEPRGSGDGGGGGSPRTRSRSAARSVSPRDRSERDDGARERDEEGEPVRERDAGYDGN